MISRLHHKHQQQNCTFTSTSIHLLIHQRRRLLSFSSGLLLNFQLKLNSSSHGFISRWLLLLTLPRRTRLLAILLNDPEVCRFCIVPSLSNSSRHSQELLSEISTNLAEPRRFFQREGSYYCQHPNQRWSPSFVLRGISPYRISPTIRRQQLYWRHTRTLSTTQVGRGQPISHRARALVYYEDHRTKDSLCQTLRPGRGPV